MFTLTTVCSIRLPPTSMYTAELISIDAKVYYYRDRKKDAYLAEVISSNMFVLVDL